MFLADSCIKSKHIAISARPHTKYKAQTTNFCERHVPKLAPAVAGGDVTIDDDVEKIIAVEGERDTDWGVDEAVKLFPGT